MALWTFSLFPVLASQMGDSGTKSERRRKTTCGMERKRIASEKELTLRPMLIPVRRPMFTMDRMEMVKRPRNRTRERSVSRCRQAGRRQPQERPAWGGPKEYYYKNENRAKENDLYYMDREMLLAKMTIPAVNSSLFLS
jgi:hypothetical protein